MSLHGSLDEQPVLVTAVVVVVNIAFNRGNELFSACKSMPIIALTLQDSPEAFHRAVVNAAANTGHMYFGHLSQINVATGQKLKPGDLIGVEGSTGHSTGSHLHWEIRINDIKTG